MRDTSTSTICQLLYSKQLQINFAQMVGELDNALSHCPSPVRSLAWDCEDTAMFDMDGARIVLAHVDNPGAGHAACLIASVGPSPSLRGNSPLLKRAEATCRLIVERIQSRFPADAVLWQHTPAPVTAELLDQMTDKLPPMEEIAALRRTSPRFDENLVVVANDVPDLPLLTAEELQRVREALYPPTDDEPERPALAMRLAVHAMNSTLILVSLPVGAAMLTYSVLRGEDMRLTGRAMALTGAGLAFTHSHMGQTVLAMI